jgi:hypothetical protein
MSFNPHDNERQPLSKQARISPFVGAGKTQSQPRAGVQDTAWADASGREPLAAHRASKPRRKAGWIGAVAVALSLIVGYTTFHNAPAPTATESVAVVASETGSPAYRMHKIANPNTPIPLSQADFDAKATDQAVAAAREGRPIAGWTDASPQLRESIAKGDVKLYAIRAYDTCAEDGDWVTFTTESGARIGTFMLTNAGKTVFIPIVGGQVPLVTLTGDKDGVGGITVGVQSGGGLWYSGVLPPGGSQAIHLQMK